MALKDWEKVEENDYKSKKTSERLFVHSFKPSVNATGEGAKMKYAVYSNLHQFHLHMAKTKKEAHDFLMHKMKHPNVPYHMRK